MNSRLKAQRLRISSEVPGAARSWATGVPFTVRTRMGTMGMVAKRDAPLVATTS